MALCSWQAACSSGPGARKRLPASDTLRRSSSVLESRVRSSGWRSARCSVRPTSFPRCGSTLSTTQRRCSPWPWRPVRACSPFPTCSGPSTVGERAARTSFRRHVWDRRYFALSRPRRRRPRLVPPLRRSARHRRLGRGDRPRALGYLGYHAETSGHFGGAVQAGIEVFDAVLRIGTNTVSFARLAAFGLTHAALCGLVWSATTALWHRGPTLWWAAIVIFLVGNAVAFTLEGLVAGIQALRLEYYELFSRVFVAEGLLFRPWHIPIRLAKETPCSPG